MSLVSKDVMQSEPQVNLLDEDLLHKFDLIQNYSGQPASNVSEIEGSVLSNSSS